MRLLDLFSGAGGAAMGYHRAGFTEIVGVDIAPQPRYPFTFVQADAMTFPLEGFDAIHASPPCQDHCKSPGAMKAHGTGWMLEATRERLEASGLPWVIENVPGAPLRPDYAICGCQVGLKQLRRLRLFETSWQGSAELPPHDHSQHAITVTGNGTPLGTWKLFGSLPLSEFQRVMGIDWMRRKELSQAIPPAYTELIGRQLVAHLASLPSSPVGGNQP